MRPPTDRGNIVIERVSPRIEGGRYRPKAIAGDDVEVSADIFRDGPALLLAVVKHRGPSDGDWSEVPMRSLGDDRWAALWQPGEIGRHRYTIEAWTDHFGTWRRDLVRRIEAGQVVDLELEEGALMLEDHEALVPAAAKTMLLEALAAIRGPAGAGGFADARVIAALSPDVSETMRLHHRRTGSSTLDPPLELTVDRERARFGAWYEFFPRSTGTKTRHGTLETAAAHLSRVAEMGFDVVYLPPIHPIGVTNRKGRNNALVARPDDVGVPWAIGGPEGGHDAVHPALGTIEDFDAFVAEAGRLGIEVALDFAIQASPDHPWVTEHPEWFHHRPDGTIKFAENPPKKYEDVLPVNFDIDNAQELWTELKRIVDHWIAHGVKIFRVDNPHTKPFPFWEWLIDSVLQEHPDVIFLAEAFTRPKIMQSLAKHGFTQSYTYFTWRNSKAEVEDYLRELTETEMALYFRPNFFTNTQDILHEYLQTGGPPAFKIRLVLAAMLSPTYGVYSGFELFENTPRESGSEEYLDSEKYELRPRDHRRGPTLAPYIRKINEIRAKHPALSELVNLRFHHADKDSITVFSKTSQGHDPILCVVNLNPFHWEEATVTLDLAALGIEPAASFEVHDLVTGHSFVWQGPRGYVRLDPFEEPAHIFVVRR